LFQHVFFSNGFFFDFFLPIPQKEKSLPKKPKVTMLTFSNYGFADDVDATNLMVTFLVLELGSFVACCFGYYHLLQNKMFLKTTLGRCLCQTWVMTDSNGVINPDNSPTTSGADPTNNTAYVTLKANEMLAKWVQGYVLPSLHDKNQVAWHALSVEDPFHKGFKTCSYDWYLKNVKYSDEQDEKTDKGLTTQQLYGNDLSRFSADESPGCQYAHLVQQYKDMLRERNGFVFNKPFATWLSNYSSILSIHTFERDIEHIKAILQNHHRRECAHFVVVRDKKKLWIDADATPGYMQVLELPRDFLGQTSPQYKYDTKLLTRFEFEEYVIAHPYVVCIVQEDYESWERAGKTERSGKIGWTHYVSWFQIIRTVIWDDDNCCWNYDVPTTNFFHVNPYFAATELGYFDKIFLPSSVVYSFAFWLTAFCASILLTCVTMLLLFYVVPTVLLVAVLVGGRWYWARTHKHKSATASQ